MDRLGRLVFLSMSVLLVWVGLLSQAQAQGQTSPLVAGLGKEFVSETAKVHGITFHCVRGGKRASRHPYPWVPTGLVRVPRDHPAFAAFAMTDSEGLYNAQRGT